MGGLSANERPDSGCIFREAHAPRVVRASVPDQNSKIAYRRKPGQRQWRVLRRSFSRAPCGYTAQLFPPPASPRTMSLTNDLASPNNINVFSR